MFKISGNRMLQFKNRYFDCPYQLREEYFSSKSVFQCNLIDNGHLGNMSDYGK